MNQGPWHVLHVTANHEKKVAQHLSVRELEHYLPLYTERSCWTDRTVVLERPLFTGYVFVRYPPGSRLSVISVPGVIRLLGEGDHGVVAFEELDRIRSGLANGRLLRPHPNLVAGTKVRVRSGVFQGVQGVVAELRRRSKVVIELAAIKQCFSLEVACEEIDILGESRSRWAAASAGVSLGF